jgi:uncharacterized membrane protein
VTVTSPGAPPPFHPLHPLHALLLAFPIALFPSALLADITYLNTAEVQWTNFAAWLNAGALLVGGFAVIWSLIDAIRLRRTAVAKRELLLFVLLAVMWIVGLINAFQHSRDGWSSVEITGLILSIVSAGLALGAGWIAFSRRRSA